MMSFFSCEGVQRGSESQPHGSPGAVQPQGASSGAEGHRRCRRGQHRIHHLRWATPPSSRWKYNQFSGLIRPSCALCFSPVPSSHQCQCQRQHHQPHPHLQGLPALPHKVLQGAFFMLNCRSSLIYKLNCFLTCRQVISMLLVGCFLELQSCDFVMIYHTSSNAQEESDKLNSEIKTKSRQKLV